MQSGFDIDLKLTDRPHGFITAYRSEYNEEQYRKMAELLEAEMKYSGLSYVKAEIGRVGKLGGPGAVADVFCLIDTRFHHDDFVRLMVRLCSKFRQERVLVTNPGRIPPGPEETRPRAVGYFYNARGEISGKMRNVSIAYAWEYFGWILGGRPECCRILDEVVTETRDIYNWLSGMSGLAEFRRKYGD